MYDACTDLISTLLYVNRLTTSASKDTHYESQYDVHGCDSGVCAGLQGIILKVVQEDFCKNELINRSAFGSCTNEIITIEIHFL